MKIYLIAAALCSGIITNSYATQVTRKQKKASNSSKQINHALDTMLLEAAKKGDVKTIQKLFAGNIIPDVNAKGNTGFSALTEASDKGHTATVQALIAAGTDINAQDRHRYTALMYAAMEGRTASVQVLIAAGAEPNIKDKCGYTARRWAKDKNAYDKAVAAGLAERKAYITKIIEEEKYLIPDLSNIVTEYVAPCPSNVSESKNKEDADKK